MIKNRIPSILLYVQVKNDMLFWPSGSAFPYNQLDATAKAVTGQLKGVITYTVYDTATNASMNQFVLTTTIGDLKGVCLGHRQGFYDEITEFRYIYQLFSKF